MIKSTLILSLTIIVVSCLALVTKQSHTDPAVPDDSDMAVIDQWINSEKNKNKEDLGNENPSRGGSLDPSTTSSSLSNTSPSSVDSIIRKNKNGELCRCVRYYLCEVKQPEVTTLATTPLGTTPELTKIISTQSKQITETPATTSAATEATSSESDESQNIFDIVDIRNGLNFTCPGGDFDICCALKDIREEVTLHTTTAVPTTLPTITTISTRPPSSQHSEHRHCGQRKENGVGNNNIPTTAKQAKFGEFPWTVAVINTEQNEDNFTVLKYIGGGSLLHPQVVLTVAHNVLGKSRTTLKVRLGEWDTQTNDEIYPSQDRGVKKIIIHELFLKKTLYNDVALLILDEEVKFAPNVDTICLPPVPRKGREPINFDGQLCYSSGWGKDHFGVEGRYSEVMKKVTVPVVSHDKCQKELQKSEKLPGFRLDKSFMCAGGGDDGEDTCKGDGGAPLVCSVIGGRVDDEDDGLYYVQVGAVSFGLSCNSKIYPGVYADIQKLTPWILEKMEKEEMSTEYCTFKYS